MPCTLEFEDELRRAGACVVAGVDETGRGSLAGPVFAAAVVLPEGFFHPTLNDSKQLLPEEREAIYAELQAGGRTVISFAWASVAEIDRMNILRASHLAMKRALSGLPVRPDGVLVDGLPIRRFGWVHRAVVSGDALSFSIAAASVVAKVERDRLMTRLAKRFPAYGFDRHKGYGTPEHLEALHRHGICKHHRLSFEPVAQQTFGFEFAAAMPAAGSLSTVTPADGPSLIPPAAQSGAPEAV